jgi:hypothetical protein
MASGVDLLMYVNTSCVECSDMGPPPDTILGIPPPPLPAFLQRAPIINNTSTCSVLCDWTAGPGVEYVELPRHGNPQSFNLTACKNSERNERILKLCRVIGICNIILQNEGGLYV